MYKSDQLELELSSDTPAAIPAASPLPRYIVTPASTPGAILQWWDALVSGYVGNTDSAEVRAKAIEAEIALLRGNRDGASRRQIRALRAKCDEIRREAIAFEFEASALFEATLSEFSPALIAMLQAEGLAIPDDDEMSVACFWDCLQRPAIEYVANVPLSELAREYAREALAQIAKDGDTATAN